jgi:hypothetical protein
MKNGNEKKKREKEVKFDLLIIIMNIKYYIFD